VEGNGFSSEVFLLAGKKVKCSFSAKSYLYCPNPDYNEPSPTIALLADAV
jgi:hypothetical protein